MNFYPVFLNLKQKEVLFCGAGELAVAKIRLLKKTPARIVVFGKNPVAQIKRWHREKSIKLIERNLEASDMTKKKPGEIALIFAASGNKSEDLRILEIGKKNSIAVNIIDDLANSEFLTPAIVDRNPVTIAIGTEGSAPVLARKIKAQIEEIIPFDTGVLARAAMGFRNIAARLPNSKSRRIFWKKFFAKEGPEALRNGGEAAIFPALQALFHNYNSEQHAYPSFSLVGAGPGAPEHLTLRARLLIGEADLIIHDPGIDGAIIDLARREAQFVDTRNIFSTLMTLLPDVSNNNKQVVILVPGTARVRNFDPRIFDILKEQKIPFEMVPGINMEPGSLQTRYHYHQHDQDGHAIKRAANSNDFNEKPSQIKNFGILESLI